MRGSIDWQTAELTKAIFFEGLKKEERTDQTNQYYGCVGSYKSMETYRSVWNNFGFYLKEYWMIKDYEQITGEHIESYMLYKIEYYPSKQYLEKISSALGKLEFALKIYTFQKYGIEKFYDFNTRKIQLALAKNLNKVFDGYRSRIYENPPTGDIFVETFKTPTCCSHTAKWCSQS